MAAAPLDPIYLIGGTDRPKVELAIRRLRARVRAEDGSIEEFTADRMASPTSAGITTGQLRCAAYLASWK